MFNFSFFFKRIQGRKIEFEFQFQFVMIKKKTSIRYKKQNGCYSYSPLIVFED